MKSVLFCDYGLDDAAATVDLLKHASQDGYHGVDLVAIGGNVPSAVALKNAVKLLRNLDFPRPRNTRIVDTTALPQPCRFLKRIHGDDGMGDLFEDAEPLDLEIIPFSAWLEEEEPFVLLSLGPMTLVPYALRKNPERFLFMGGNIAETPNYRGYEFNHALDRKAFSECVKYPHVAVTMDTCRNPLINLQDREIPPSDLLHKIIGRARERSFLSGEKGCYVWDDIAVKCLRHPDWFETYSARDRDGNMLNVARYIRSDLFLDLIGE